MPRPARAIPLILLPTLLWFLACFFFLGDTGKWLDDYAAHVRNPVTGSFAWSDLLRYQWWFIWRPIHVHLVYTLQTLLWNHDWLNHLFSASMHALACLALRHFLRECGLKPLTAACAALAMLCSPQSVEAIFWPATVSTTIACAAFLFASRIVVRFAQHRHKPAAIPALGLLGLAIPCLYEQPAAALAALPILYLAAVPLGFRPMSSPHVPSGATGGLPASDVATSTHKNKHTRLLHHARRCTLALTPCVLGILLYLTAFLITAHTDDMARESRFAHPHQIWGRARYTLGILWLMLAPNDSGGGILELARQGLATLRDSRLGLPGWSLAILIAATAWLAAWIGPPSQREGAGGWVRKTHESKDANEPQIPTLNRPLLILFSLAALALSLLPVIAISGAGLSPRLTYFPLCCVIIALAAAIDLLASLPARKPLLAAPLRIAVPILTLVYCLWGTVALIGVQSFYKERHAKDRAQFAALHALVPNPAPDTVFVPVHIWLDPRDPKAHRHRNSFQPIWASSWAVGTMVKHEYGRADVHCCCIYIHNQACAILRVGDRVMLSWSHLMWNLPTPRIDNFCPRTPRDKVIPFIIGENGEIALVHELVIGHVDGGDRAFTFPQVSGLRDKGLATRSVPIALPLDNGGEWIVDWRWPRRDDDEVKFRRTASWGASERAVRMHPHIPGHSIADGDTDEMTLALAPSKSPRTFVFHATFADDTINASLMGDGVELVWSLDDDKPLAALALDPKKIAADKRWLPAVVTIPPLDRPRTLRLRCNPGPRGNTTCDRVIVSCGVELGTTDTIPIGIPAPRPR